MAAVRVAAASACQAVLHPVGVAWAAVLVDRVWVGDWCAMIARRKLLAVLRLHLLLHRLHLPLQRQVVQVHRLPAPLPQLLLLQRQVPRMAAA